MFSIFKKKKIVSHLRLTGVIGNVGKFRQGIEYSGQEDIIKKAFSVKKAEAAFGPQPVSSQPWSGGLLLRIFPETDINRVMIFGYIPVDVLQALVADLNVDLALAYSCEELHECRYDTETSSACQPGQGASQPGLGQPARYHPNIQSHC